MNADLLLWTKLNINCNINCNVKTFKQAGIKYKLGH